MSQQAGEIQVSLDAVTFTNRDMIDFKRITGRSMQAMFSDPKFQDDPDFEGIAALTWIVVRKSDPTFTYEDALDSDVNAPFLVDAFAAMQADPTAPADDSTSSDAGSTTS